MAGPDARAGIGSERGLAGDLAFDVGENQENAVLRRELGRHSAGQSA